MMQQLRIPIKTAIDSDFKTTRYTDRKTTIGSDSNPANF
jgi:hypothetical protein